jgi:hypothetical protein
MGNRTRYIHQNPAVSRIFAIGGTGSRESGAFSGQGSEFEPRLPLHIPSEVIATSEGFFSLLLSTFHPFS